MEIRRADASSRRYATNSILIEDDENNNPNNK